MTEHFSPDIEPSALLGLHNELADELNAEKERLAALKAGRELEDISGDPSLNYLQGKVTGFDVAMNAIQAFIVANRADAAGKLEPEQAAISDPTE